MLAKTFMGLTRSKKYRAKSYLKQMRERSSISLTVLYSGRSFRQVCGLSYKDGSFPSLLAFFSRILLFKVLCGLLRLFKFLMQPRFFILFLVYLLS